MSISNYKVNLFCREDASKIEGYEEAIKSDEQFDCHHRLELHADGSLRFTTASLKKLDLYYNRPACELVFITHSTHISLHTKARWESGQLKINFGSSRKGMKLSHPMSEEHKKHLSESMEGKVRSEESIEKFRQTMTGRKRKPFSKEWKHNIGNYARGKTWRVVDGKRVWVEKGE